MFLKKLVLTNFKSHKSFDCDFDKKIIFIYGQNGAGKTNILDAINYISLFKSHIQHQDIKLINNESDFFRIEAKFEENYEVVCKLKEKRKEVLVNDVKLTKLNSHFGHIPYILSSPNDIFLLFGGSEERRKFIDYSISFYDKSYLKTLIEYNKVLSQRNSLLKSEKVNDILLTTYTDRLIALCDDIYPVRKIFLQNLIELSSKWYAEIASEKEIIDIEYISHLNTGNLSAQFKNNLEKDKILKRTSIGIHKDDIQISKDGVDAKKIASQGQIKTILYSLRFSQAEYIAQKIEKKLIFSIDDFSDRLDEPRRQNLFSIMKNINFVSQWFVTDVECDFYEECMQIVNLK